MPSSPTAGAPRWRVLVTGATGRVGFPVARALASHHEVFGLARCRHEGDRARLEDAGVQPIVADVAEVDLRRLPEGITHVFHAAARLGREAQDADWQQVFATNAQASGRLVAACPGAAFVYCSTGSAYEYQGQRPLREDDPPGVHLGAYSLSKIAGEAVVRFAAGQAGSPLTIIRIFSTYGPEGGTPVNRLRRIRRGEEIVLHPDAPNHYNPVYEDDYVRLAVRALQVASIDPVVVNFAGSETVSAEEYCAYLGELVGRPALIRYDPAAPWPIWPDVTRMHAVLGRTEVPWHEGMHRWPGPCCERRDPPRPAGVLLPIPYGGIGYGDRRSMRPGYIESKDVLQKRLRRVEGQVRGIQRMVDEDRYCIDILEQVSAATKALQAVALELLDDHLAHCVSDAVREGGDEAAEKLHEASAAIARLVRS